MQMVNITINVDPGNYTLVVSYLGYNTEEFKVNVTGSSSTDATLTPSALEIEALQVWNNYQRSENTFSSFFVDFRRFRVESCF